MLRPSRERLSQVHRLKSPGHVHDISVAGVDSLGDAADTNKVYGVPCLQKILGDQRLSHGCSEGSNADEKNKEKERPADVKATDVTTRTTAPSSALCTFPGGKGERPAGDATAPCWGEILLFILARASLFWLHLGTRKKKWKVVYVCVFGYCGCGGLLLCVCLAGGE